MVYTVTFNPAMDYVMQVKNMNEKDINRSEEETMFYGGKGINVSSVLTQLDIENTATGFLTGFTGNELERMLKADNINTNFVHLKTGFTRINVKIKSEKELDINAHGPDISEQDIDELLNKLKKIKSGDYLVLAGSVPHSLSDDIYEKILEHFTDKDINVVVDTTGNLLKNILKYKPFLIKPNHHELGEIFSVDINSTQDVIRYAKKLQEMGAKNVLVSRAKDGATLIDENGNVISVTNAPGKIVSSVGCGDSMVAGFIAGYIESKNYEKALRLGAVCANATAFSSSIAKKKEIDNMFLNESIYIKQKGT
ncbi:MAG TPA: 1-phosphofructokinase [Ruminococcus sp.]|nr:1-phosphofructokinase [Ruminococcus sp.]